VAKPIYQKRTFIRQGSAWRLGLEARFLYCQLGPSQPLLLHREPNNPVDVNAVRVTDVLNAPCGYIAREHAPIISAKLAAGEMLLARTNGPCLCKIRRVLIWSEGSADIEDPATLQERHEHFERARRVEKIDG